MYVADHHEAPSPLLQLNDEHQCSVCHGRSQCTKVELQLESDQAYEVEFVHLAITTDAFSVTDRPARVKHVVKLLVEEFGAV